MKSNFEWDIERQTEDAMKALEAHWTETGTPIRGDTGGIEAAVYRHLWRSWVTCQPGVVIPPLELPAHLRKKIMTTD